MYQILIVDDEPFITDGLYRLFSGMKELSLEVYRAYSAKEALSLLNKYRMDIVITDIQMVGLTGLDLTSQIKQHWPDCRIIILSGYNDFEYAQTAIELGADYYLLKSQGDDKLIEAVKKCISHIDKLHDESEWKEKVAQSLKKVQPILCREYLFNLLQGMKQSTEERNISFIESGIELDASENIYMVGARLDSINNKKNTYSALTKQLATIDTVFKEYISYCSSSIQFNWNYRYILWLIQPSKSFDIQKSNFFFFLRGIMDQIQRYCNKRLKSPVSFIIEPAPIKWDELSSYYMKLKHILTFQLSTQDEMVLGNTIFFDNNLTERDFNNNIHTILKQHEQLSVSLEYRQKDKFFSQLQLLLAQLLDFSQRETQFVIYHNLSSVLLNHIILADKLEEYLKHFHNLNLFSTVYEQWNSDLCDKFMEISDWIFESEKNENEQRVKQMIYILHEYISQHLNEDLSLTKLAEKVYLNPVYLSRVYKQITGVNISKYIADCRLKKAKELLKKPAYKINEIAYAVGYESPAHFSRVFKKSVGISPQDYRDK